MNVSDEDALYRLHHVFCPERSAYKTAMHGQHLCDAFLLVGFDTPLRFSEGAVVHKICEGAVVHEICEVVAGVHRCVYLLFPAKQSVKEKGIRGRAYLSFRLLQIPYHPQHIDTSHQLVREGIIAGPEPS
jgi:hypothetical protein